MLEKSPEQRILAAIDIAHNYGQTDGDHHKLWVIDQMIRVLLGEKDYAKFVEDYERPEPDEEMSYTWDNGIAP